MRRILVFSFFPAFVPATNGGQVRLFNFYQELSRSNHITLLSSSHVGAQEEVVNHGLNFVERRIAKDEHFVNQYSALGQYSAGGDLSAPAVAAAGGLPTLMHRAYIEEYEHTDIVIHDGPFTVEYDLFAGTDGKPRIYNAYNCESSLYRQLHSGEKSQKIHEIVCAAEKRMLAVADLVLYCSESDLSQFIELSGNRALNAFYVPNGMRAAVGIQSSPASVKSRFRAVFMGSGHPPNIIAATFIAETLAALCPDIDFEIIGSCLDNGNYHRNVKLYGIVSDTEKVRILRQADIALNPMTAGSGSNVKVLEYFSFGLPVLSTEFGMRGIQAVAERDYISAKIGNFALALAQAVNDTALLAVVAAAGKELAENAYTWKAIAQTVAEPLGKLLDSRKDEECLRHILVLNDYDSFDGIGGGGTRTRGLYEAACSWSPVVFVSFSEGGRLSSRRYNGGIIVINVPKTQDHVAEIVRINGQFHVSAEDIIAIRHCEINPWLNSIYRILRNNARCIVVEHCYMVGLPLMWGDRFIYSSQNNETTLKARLLCGHPLSGELISIVANSERLAVECSCATIAVSLEDAVSLVSGKLTSGPVLVVRNGADLPADDRLVEIARSTLHEDFGLRSVVFLGSAHLPNVDAAQFIVKTLAVKMPDVTFHFVGAVCSAVLNAPSNVRLWGVVDEVTKSAILTSCSVALNPMSSGSGSNVKLADYLGNGLFVVTTEFGQRGYPSSIREHAAVVSMEDFTVAIESSIAQFNNFTTQTKVRRRKLFERELALPAIAKRFVEILQNLEVTRKRILYVAYRYVSPALGGAEANIENFVKALGSSGKFDVDVVAPQISGIHNHWRFSETYTFDKDLTVPIDIPNVRFAHFPADAPSAGEIQTGLRNIWSAQPSYERAVHQELRDYYEEPGLTWGWADSESDGARWAFTECGLFFNRPSRVVLEGYTDSVIVISAFTGDRVFGGPWTVNGMFSLDLAVDEGCVRLETSAQAPAIDPRPLAFRLSKISIDGRCLSLSSPTLVQTHLPLLPAMQQFRVLDDAAQVSRYARGVRLTESRGPWSNAMDQFIAERVGDYDLVVAHNNIFRSAFVAIDAAKKRGVPSILVPHAHLDDDFYHFADLLDSARSASLVLAAPKAACQFLTEKSCNVRYMPAGCDTSEQFTSKDQDAFHSNYASNRRFILVLGRKAGAKGYRKIIKAVDELNKDGIDLNVVLIGPDDDGIPIASKNAIYLGRQPRDVVRGALLSCIALCNMSESESFGIVLLEAWLAGKPVIANKNCVAFHDMAIHDVNALLVDENELSGAIKTIVTSHLIAASLASNGATIPYEYSWDEVCSRFVTICLESTTAELS